MRNADILLCHPVRTAIGAYGGTLKGVPAAELGATVVHETLARAGLAPEAIGSVIQAGKQCCMPCAGTGCGAAW
ncbi:thiolase family protein [Belnapia rosea]|uniref:Thiolase, N-terminal domain n=1 Tax=Belnapia rosea TaxID=938405 RepID=A0A1G6SZF0_9PROT|nr:hypothetical protein [Belnapia rosea]SDB60053.1 Thiolase, N-terminal domain [Belnapia rosea]SDD22004.1 Thiolase, N-terminal domain [Belnapia rosea]